jgi:hypothetical protein
MADPQLPQFVDRPEVSETFADSVYSITSGAGVFALALTVTRSAQGQPPIFSRVLSSRLVITLPAAIDLHQRMGLMLAELQKQGQIPPLKPPDVKSIPSS